jgi:hypothetical protein
MSNHVSVLTRVRRAALCGLVVTSIFIAGCSGGNENAPASPTSPTPTPSPTPSPTPATPSNPGALSVQMIASGDTCTATSDTPVSCTFVAQVSGGQAPFTYTWTFSSANGTSLTVQGQEVRPVFGCTFSSGEPDFRAYIALSVTQAGGGGVTIQNDQKVYRVAGHC